MAPYDANESGNAEQMVKDFYQSKCVININKICENNVTLIIIRLLGHGHFGEVGL